MVRRRRRTAPAHHRRRVPCRDAQLNATTKLPATIDHWQDAPEYKAALSINTAEDELAGAGSSTRFSGDTGITFDNGLVSWKDTHLSGGGCTRTEMRGMLLVKNGVLLNPPRDAQQFTDWVTTAATRESREFGLARFKSLRHQWSVAGGVRDGNGTFQRFLQLALAAGNWV